MKKALSLILSIVLCLSVCVGCFTKSYSSVVDEEPAETSEDWTNYDEIAYRSCVKLQKMMKDPDSLRIYDVYILQNLDSEKIISGNLYIFIESSGTNTYGARISSTEIFVADKEDVEDGDYMCFFLSSLKDLNEKDTDDCYPAELAARVLAFMYSINTFSGEDPAESMGDEYIRVNVEAISEKMGLS